MVVVTNILDLRAGALDAHQKYIRSYIDVVDDWFRALMEYSRILDLSFNPEI